jgi:hypothetical protein
MWISFNLIYTGNPFYFILVRNAWIDIPVPVFVLNIALISHFFDLPWHYFHTSKVEIITFFIFGSLVCLSRKMIDRTLLLISTALFLGPLFFTDLMSFSRYQIINFPIFLYLAIDLPGSLYRTLITVFYISLLIIGVFFINWYWIG